MPLTINSPHSGRPVKVRDSDVGRSIRDEEGRVFYVLPRQNGEGFYGALTRKGSEKDEQRYDAMEKKSAIARDTGAERSAAQVHDATGTGRPGTKRRALYLLLFAVILAVIAWFVLSTYYPQALGPLQPAPGSIPGSTPENIEEAQPAAKGPLPLHLYINPPLATALPLAA
jgi:hypothetical protein